MKIILLICVVGFSFVKSADAQKIKYEEVNEVLNKDKKLAKKYLQEFIKQSPQHALAMYQLGKILEIELREIDIYDEVDFERKYKTVLNLYQVAEAMATKREAAKNKSYYQKLFNTKKVSASVLKFTYQQELARLKNFYDTIEDIRSKTALIQHFYKQQEIDYDSLVAYFDHFPDIYFSTSDYLVKRLNEIVSRADNMQANIKQVQALLTNQYPQTTPKDYHFNTFEGFNAQKVSDASFKNTRVNLYDYGKWAGNIMQFIRNEILPLRNNILEADARLTATINRYYLDNAVLSHLDYYDASPLIFKLFQLDGNSLAAKVLMYKKLKADYLSRIMENEFDFTQDSGKVVKNAIESSREVLKNIKVTQVGYDNYRGYFTKVYTDKEGLEGYLQKEEIFWDSEYQSLKAGAIAGNGSNQQLYANFTETATTANVPNLGKVTGAKINIDLQLINKDSLVAFGGYAVQESFQLEQNRWMALGNAPSEFNGKKDVFVAKVDERQNVYWLRKFMHVQENQPYDLEIEKVITSENKQVFMILKAAAGPSVQYRVVGLSEKGKLLFDEELTQVGTPRALLYLAKEEKLLLALKGRKKTDSYEQFEECIFVELNLAGIETGRFSLGIKGVFAGNTEVQQGYVLAFNFLNYKAGENQFVNSKAITKGGMNALIVHFNEAGSLMEILPVFTEEPVFVTELFAKPDGGLVLKGKKGIYSMGDPALENGDTWEQELKLKDKL